MDTSRLQRKRATKKYLKKRAGKRNVDSGLSTAGERWRWQHKTELDGDKWSVAFAPLEATWHQLSQ